jgi:hypothetical protein
MGFGKSFKKAVGKVLSPLPASIRPIAGLSLGGIGGYSAGKYQNRAEKAERAKSLGLPETATEEQITTANLYRNLSPEQQKDLLLNNPNIYTPEGSQIYDPLTNSVRLNEGDFTKAERLRQESLAGQLSGSLSGDFSNSGQAIQDATFQRGKAQIDPIIQSQKKDLAQQLADQGIPAGSEQYNEAMNRLDDSIARQYTDLSQASIATGEQVRQSRFNEISSLLGRSQVGSGTSFGGYQPNYNGIDLAGYAQQSQMQSQQLSFMGSQAQKNRSSARTAALIGAGASLGSACNLCKIFWCKIIIRGNKWQ